MTTGIANMSEEYAKTYDFGKPGLYAQLTVSDSGEGMEEETRKRIFEPFYTTKEVGKGTGLGLAVVYGIVKQHDGYINVYSEPGHGTTFRIYLPLIASEAWEDDNTCQKETSFSGTETILLAEDNDLVRNLVRTVLEESGYTVIEAVDGEDAVRKFLEHSGSIHLLLLDLIMPKMNGKAVSHEIQKLQPGLKTIYCSGYAPDIIQHKVSLGPGAHLIHKPVSAPYLLKMVRSVLDGVA